MDDPGPIDEWRHLFARSERSDRDRAEWERGKGRQTISDRLPTAIAPATEDQIARVEARLGVRLPPSLRSFYLSSNGFGNVGNFIWSVRSVEHLGWLREAVPHLYEITVEDDPAVARCLIVSGDADAAYWLLDPGDVDGRGEWRAGCWASWYPGMRWVAYGFFELFKDAVVAAERLLARERTPPPPIGAGRRRNEHSVGDVNSTAVPGRSLARNGYMYVPAEGFASVVTLSAPSTARVGEWVHISATRRNGPWNPVPQAEVRPGEISLFEPRIFEQEVAANLTLRIEPPAAARFDSDDSAGTAPNARSVAFDAPGTYELHGYSAFPLPVLSNTITIKVE